MSKKDRISPSFGEFIMSQRKKQNLRLRDVASHCNVSINFISLIERGKKLPSDKVIMKLSEILNVEDSKLFSMINRISPAIIESVNTAEHEGLRELLTQIHEKVKEESLRQELLDEVYSVYNDFLKRHNLT